MRQLALFAISFLLASPVMAQDVIFQSNFESEDDFVVLQSSDDGDAEFGYDYADFDGIPEAPNTDKVGGAAQTGLKLQSNLELGEFHAVAVATDGLDLTGGYSVQVDAWLNYVITAGTSGTTEFGGLSVGHDGVAPGVWGASFLYDTDGDSSSDYRLYKDTVRQGLETFQYEEDSWDNSSEPFVSAFPGVDVAEVVPEQAIEGITRDGSGAFRWMTIEAVYDPNGAIANNSEDKGTASFSITDASSGNTVNIGTIDNSNGDGTTTFGDEVAVVFSDIFTSLSGDPNLSFGIFDNLIVSTVDEVADPLDCDSSGAVDSADIACATADTITQTLEAANIPAGDLDLDGAVQFSDFLILSTNFGSGFGVSYADGDIDLSGAVDFADFLVLSANFGATAGAASVPEPSGIALLGFGLFALCARRRRN